MASPAAARSPATTSAATPLQRLSTFKHPTTTTTASSALDSIASDPIFSAFLSPSFSSTTFSAAALSSGSPASAAEKLHHVIGLLENQLRSEVLSRHEELLSQLSSLHHADHALSTLRSALSSLQSSLRRLPSELSDPHRSIASKTAQLSNLHRTTELLQHSVRALRLSKKLRDLMAAEPEKLDLAKAAQLHSEIISLCNEYDLTGIDVVDEELPWVRESEDRLWNEAMKVLESGMEELNQAEFGTGLQVFYNLDELKVTVEQVINKYKGMNSNHQSNNLYNPSNWNRVLFPSNPRPVETTNVNDRFNPSNWDRVLFPSNPRPVETTNVNDRFNPSNWDRVLFPSNPRPVETTNVSVGRSDRFNPSNWDRVLFPSNPRPVETTNVSVGRSNRCNPCNWGRVLFNPPSNPRPVETTNVSVGRSNRYNPRSWGRVLFNPFWNRRSVVTTRNVGSGVQTSNVETTNNVVGGGGVETSNVGRGVETSNVGGGGGGGGGVETSNGKDVETTSNVGAELDKTKSSDGGFYDCNICLDLAKDPVVTYCGHLFCWSCLYRWLYLRSSQTIQCPVCKGEVTDQNVIPIYGGRGSNVEVSSSSAAFQIPRRPTARREIEGF